LGQVVLALILEENYLRRYLGNQGVAAEGEWARVITEFFQKMIYSTARGYEVALAHSNRLAQRAGGPPGPGGKPPAPEPVPQAEGDIEISRGGQVGEVAG